MVKEFSEYERERAIENMRADQTRMNAEQRVKAHAADVLDRIVNHMIEKGISGVEHGTDQSDNSVILKRSTGTLKISFREIGDPMIHGAEWEYSIDQRRAGDRSGGAISIEQTADNLDNSGLTDQQMAWKVMDWLRER
jgi:hypothetical protein